jgi:putative copper export protein
MELADIHGWTGYVVFVVVIAVAVMAFNRAKNAQEFEDTPFKVAAILLDLQVLLGLVVYGVGQYWSGDEPLIQYVHPVVMLLALGLAHAGLGGARKEQMAADAHRKVGRMLLIAVVLLIAGIGVASAA